MHTTLLRNKVRQTNELGTAHRTVALLLAMGSGLLGCNEEPALEERVAPTPDALEVEEKESGTLTCGEAQKELSQAFNRDSALLGDLLACKVDSDCTTVDTHFRCETPVSLYGAVCAATAIAAESVGTFQARFLELHASICSRLRGPSDFECVVVADCFSNTAACVEGACQLK